MGYVIVGLGNPGEEYARTRHNAGRMAVMHFAASAGAGEWKKNAKANAQVATLASDAGKAVLVLPDTFMNKSGSAVAAFVKNVKAAKQLVVVYDDLDLPLGKIKLAFGRGSGGHKGVESIMRAVKTKDFIRIRIGVSKKSPKGVAKKVHGEDEVIEYVLGAFRKPEQEQLDAVFETVDRALTAILLDGHEAAMNRFN
ncbi:MAG TPA: aminoacyl-tRNA hydrolase [Candidatus Paceibacterota bacterium]|nr:aminoacyl-tRNA hydrolase [Candidatus Paceibacterota bacterium]